MTGDSYGWTFVAFAPVLALGVAMVIYNAICASRRREDILPVRRGGWHEEEYRLWWESLKTSGKLARVFCPLLAVAGEACYFYCCKADLFVSVGEQPRHEFFDQVSLCVTDSHLCLQGARVDLKIPLNEVHVVSAECDNVLVDAVSLDQPLLVADVCGWLVRDVVKILRGEHWTGEPDVCL